MNKKGFQSNAHHPPADSLHFIVNKFGGGRARSQDHIQGRGEALYKEGPGPCRWIPLNRHIDMTENITFLQFR